MTNKKIFLIVVAIILVVFLIITTRGLKIKSIVDGSTIELNNGAYVTLLGLEPTAESQDFLEGLKGKKIKIVPDNSQFFNIKKMEKGVRYPAYVILKDGGNVSSQVLSLGYSRLNEANPLKDSLASFREYAALAKNKQEPTIKPRVIDYENDNIILPTPPQPLQKGERKHSRWYTDGSMNLDMLEDACDFNLPYTKAFANKLAARSPGEYNIGQICEIFDYCYNNWSYVNDPADSEYVARASESISSSLAGDCDDFAVLMASCIIAIGGHPCLNVGYNPGGGHAFTEVDISGWDEQEVMSEIQKHFSAYEISELAIRREGNHTWLNLDWQASYPGGKYYDCSSSWNAYPYICGKWTWEKLR